MCGVIFRASLSPDWKQGHGPMTIRTRVLTWLRGKQVGTDPDGNRYYVERSGGPRRWVLYDGEPEASKVPPEWNAWLHHTVDGLPAEQRQVQPWEKPHQANLTGTAAAYRPPGHASRGGKRARATGDYEAWRPD